MKRSTTTRILIPLVLSLAVHGVIIALWPTSESTLLLNPGGYTITVSLLVQAEKQPTQLKNTYKKPDTHPETYTVKPKRIAVIQKKQAAPIPVPAKDIQSIRHMTQANPVTESPSRLNKPTQVSSTELNKSGSVISRPDISTKNSHHLKKVLRKAFNAHFYYPRLAIRRGWQGEVRLSLHIEANGNLTQIRILHGSGYDLLDKAAMKSLKKVEVLPEAIALLHGRSLDLILPVKYRLL